MKDDQVARREPRKILKKKRQSKPESRFTVSTRVVEDVSGLLTALRDELRWPDLWVFRGQASWHWTLKPRFNRSFRVSEELSMKRSGASNPFTKMVESLGSRRDRREFEDWRAEAVGLVPAMLPRPASSLEWLAVGQHHGLKTRLLDWTRNPLVGVYFAISGDAGAPGDDSALFALRGLPLLEDEFLEDPWSVRGVRLWHPPSLVERIGRQSGLFTLHQVDIQGGSLDLVDYADRIWHKDPAYMPDSVVEPEFQLVKIPIQASKRTSLLDELRLLGVDEFFAFPDLAGLCRAYERGRFQRPRIEWPSQDDE